MTKSPARAGFEIVIRRPALILAEVLWRWCFGLASITLLAMVFFLYLRSITVSDADLQFMKSGSAYLMADALVHILNASKGPLLFSLAVLTPGLTVMWTIAAAVGRLVTLPPLLPAPPVARRRSPIFALMMISFLRAALVLAGFGGYLASAMIAANVSGLGENQDLGVFFAVFVPLLAIVILIWAVLNWLLSVAPIFAVRDRGSAIAAFADTVRLLQRGPRDFIAVGSLYSLPRFIAIVVATVVSFALVSAAPQIGKYAVAAGLIIITLIYFVFADILHLARMAAYALILERESDQVAASQGAA